MGKPIPVIICDDSRLARKQMERALSQWNLDITHATQGLEALEAIRAGKGELLFLDLNMPLLDGYQVLERIRSQDLQTLAIVVSGDVQPEARTRVLQLGALDFIRKPIDVEQLGHSLRAFGLLEELQHKATPLPATHPTDTFTASNTSAIEQALMLTEHYQELANVAMGQAASLLAQLLDTFVELPIPSVQLIESCELEMALQQSVSQTTMNTVRQGFIAPGISGEALLMLSDTETSQLASLLNHVGDITEQVERELTLDIANVLIGAFLNGLGQQLDLAFSQSSPQALESLPGGNRMVNAGQPDKILSIDINYRIEGLAVSCDLLLLFTEDSLPTLNELASHL